MAEGAQDEGKRKRGKVYQTGPENLLKKEKDVTSLLHGQKDMLTKVTEESRKLVRENDRLRAINDGLQVELDDLKQQCAILLQREKESETSCALESPTKRKTLEQNEKMTEENLILHEQTNALTTELEQLHTEIKERDKIICALQESLHVTSNASESKHSNLQQVKEEKKICEEKVVIISSKVQEYKDHCLRLEEELSTSNQLAATLGSRLDDALQEKNVLEDEAEQLRLALTDAMSSLCARRQEHIDTVATLDCIKLENVDLRKKFLSNEAEVKRTTAALEMVEGSIKDAKRQKEESLRDQDTSKTVKERFSFEKEKILAQVVTLTDELKRHREQEAERIQSSWAKHQSQIDVLRARHRDEMNKLRHQISDLCLCNGELRGQSERALLELKECSKKVDALSDTLKTERQRTQALSRATTIKLSESGTLLQKTQARCNELEMNLQSAYEKYSSCNSDKYALKERIKSMGAQSLSEMERSKEAIAELKQQIAEAAEETEKAFMNWRSDKEKLVLQLKNVKDRHEREVSALQTKLRQQEAREMEKDRERRIEDRDHSSLLDGVKMKARQALDHTEALLAKERIDNQKQKKDKEELSTQTIHLSMAREQLCAELEQATAKVTLFGRKLSSLSEKVLQNEKRLSESFKECQTLLREQTKLKLSVRERDTEIEKLRQKTYAYGER